MKLQQEFMMDLKVACSGFCFKIELVSFLLGTFKLRRGNHMINGVTDCALCETIQSQVTGTFSANADIISSHT